MQIVKDGYFKDTTYRTHDFRWPGEDSGFSFDVDAEGRPTNHHPASRANYEACITGRYEVEDRGITEYTISRWHAPLGRCVCGKETYLYGDTECVCGRRYNSAGQELL